MPNNFSTSVQSKNAGFKPQNLFNRNSLFTFGTGLAVFAVCAFSIAGISTPVLAQSVNTSAQTSTVTSAAFSLLPPTSSSSDAMMMMQNSSHSSPSSSSSSMSSSSTSQNTVVTNEFSGELTKKDGSKIFVKNGNEVKEFDVQGEVKVTKDTGTSSVDKLEVGDQLKVIANPEFKVVSIEVTSRQLIDFGKIGIPLLILIALLAALIAYFISKSKKGTIKTMTSKIG